MSGQQPLSDPGEYVEKAKDYARDHPEQARSAIDRVEDLIDDRTGGTFSDVVDQGGDLLEEHLGLPDPAPTPSRRPVHPRPRPPTPVPGPAPVPGPEPVPSPGPPPVPTPDPGSTPDAPPPAPSPDEPAPTPDAPPPVPTSDDSPAEGTGGEPSLPQPLPEGSEPPTTRTALRRPPGQAPVAPPGPMARAPTSRHPTPCRAPATTRSLGVAPATRRR